MVEYKQNFAMYNSLTEKEKSKIPFNEILVVVSKTVFANEETETMLLKDLYFQKTVKGKDEYVPIKSMKDYDDNSIFDNIFYKEENSGTFAKVPMLTSVLMYQPVSVPSVYQSTSLNKTGATEDEKVAFGLKRDLEVKEVTKGGCVYCKVAGEWTFVEKSKIFWYDGTTEKAYEDFKTLTDEQKKNVKLFYDNQEISEIYTEHEYDLISVKAKEEIDLEKGEKKTYSRAEDGTYSYSAQNLSMNISSQTFETQEIDEKEVSVVKAINYRATKDDSGEYVAITLNNQVKMVTLAEIVDVDGNPINSLLDLKKLVGQRVSVKSGDTIIATSEPLTFEQANITYNTIKTYQRVQGEATEDTCLRLEDGEYVKELETVQPISYKVATGDYFDKYLVKQAGDDGRFVVVDKDYFEKNGKNPEFDTSKVLKLQRCDFKSQDCSIVQTTSSGEAIENCDAVKDVSVDGIAVHKQNKDIAYNSFLESYKAGNYKLNDFYVNGIMRSVQKNSGRYEYTDTAYYEDWADNLHEYKSVKDGELKLKDGKVEGGAKFDFKKALKKSFSVWGVATFAAVAVVPFAGIFVTALAPLVSAYAMGCLAAAPLIPVVNGVIAFARREKTNYTDKTEYNRKKLAKQTKKELTDLYERTDLSEKQFEDAYSRIMNKIAMLSQTTSNNSLTLVNGTATVNSNNVNLAHRYKKEINHTAKLMAKCDKKVSAAQERYDELFKKAEKYVDTIVPAKLQSKLDKAKKELDELLEEQKQLKDSHDSICNTTVGESYDASPAFNSLQRKAQSLKLMKYVNQYPDSVIVSSMSDELKSKLSLSRSKDNLLVDGVSIFSDEEAVKKQSDEWKALRDEALQVLDNINNVILEKPTNGNVKEEISRVQFVDELKEKVEQLMEYIKKVEKGINLFVADENKNELLSELEKIKENLDFDNLADLDAETLNKLNNMLETKNANLDDLQQKVENVVKKQNEDKKKEEKKEKSFNVKINSEDQLVVLLKANEKAKDRKKLILYIKDKSGVEISDSDIEETIKRINKKHLEGKDATTGASKLKNINIELILTYGQQYLTMNAEEIKKRMAEHSA